MQHHRDGRVLSVLLYRVRDPFCPSFLILQRRVDKENSTLEGNVIRNTSVISREKLADCLRKEGVIVSEDEDMPCALYISGYDYLTKLMSFQKGYFYVQDLSSMEAAQWAAPGKGDVVLDVCAAPGGKALHLAELMEGAGLVVARDLTEYKVGLIQENIARSGKTGIGY